MGIVADNQKQTEAGSEPEKRDYSAYYAAGVALLAVIFFLIVGMAIYPNGEHAWGYGINLFTSIISTIATVGIIEVFSRQREKREAAEHEEANRRRDSKNAEVARQQQLIDDAASNVNDVAKNAVYQLRRKGWLREEDGLLKGADLSMANLQGADLTSANVQGAVLAGATLQEADLSMANLQGAYLWGANLQGANLVGANLQGAKLLDTKLQGAKLSRANLQGADLNVARLQGADLNMARLQGANLHRAMFDEQTILPDWNQWTAETDMKRFTDPEHPEFWRSDYWRLPAYQGESEKK